MHMFVSTRHIGNLTSDDLKHEAHLSSIVRTDYALLQLRYSESGYDRSNFSSYSCGCKRGIYVSAFCRHLTSSQLPQRSRDISSFFGSEGLSSAWGRGALRTPYYSLRG